jgi:hypothetical protein
VTAWHQTLIKKEKKTFLCLFAYGFRIVECLIVVILITQFSVASVDISLLKRSSLYSQTKGQLLLLLLLPPPLI